MSRKIRRVPIGWRHPVKHNPHWQWQTTTFGGRTRPPPRLHGLTEQFVPLHEGPLSKARAEWDTEREQWRAGDHEHLSWLLRYHSADGRVDHKGVRQAPTPYQVYDATGETVVREFFPESVQDIVAVYPYEEYAGDRPTAATHMPDFDTPADDLGWCLYETVSEGTPVTPVFATAAELVEHLATVGEDYDQVPYRRAAAEALVGHGHSGGSMVVVDGRVFDAAKDADLLDALTNPASGAG